MAANLGSEYAVPIHCSSEWHMRGNPRAFLIYSLALRITDGGKNEFYLSQSQLARYFGWDVKTVRTAFRALCDEGLFKMLRRGRGGNGMPDFASVYQVIPHSRLGAPQKCWPATLTDDSGTLPDLCVTLNSTPSIEVSAV